MPITILYLTPGPYPEILHHYGYHHLLFPFVFNTPSAVSQQKKHIYNERTSKRGTMECVYLLNAFGRMGFQDEL